MRNSQPDSDIDPQQQLLKQLESNKAKDLTTSQLESLLSYVTSKKEIGTEHWEDTQKKIDRLLTSRYKQLASNPTKQVLPIDEATAANLTPIPSRPTTTDRLVGDFNLLTQNIPIVIDPFAAVLISLAQHLVSLTDGTTPSLGVHSVVDNHSQALRMVATWQINRYLSVEELHSLYQITRQAYGKEISGYKSTGRGWQQVTSHRNFNGNVSTSGAVGIYFGPESCYYDGSINGVIAYRKFKNATEAKFLQSNHPLDFLSYATKKTPRSFIEFRDSGKTNDEDGLAQDMFLMLVTQISYLLAKGRLIESHTLMATIYRELNRVGTGHIKRDLLYGMTDVLNTIERCLLFPLQEPELAAEYHFMPESILLVGVPGIGKTFLEHYLMTSDNHAIFAAIDSDRLSADLTRSADQGASETLLRIDRITEQSSLPVVLIIDDIDVILKERGVISKFLTMMQGIRQKGLYILASTNHPEKIDKRLIEPGRLSKIVHVRLPNRDDRRGVLKKYLDELPFESPTIREQVLDTEADSTRNWTQRYLWELSLEAARIRAQKMHHQGDHGHLTPADFRNARTQLEKAVNFKAIADWDNRIARALSHSDQRVGFK